MKKPAYSAALDRVLFRASRLARELGGAQTGTEHLLLALSQERISQTGRILCYQGAEGRLLRCMLLTRQEPEPAGRQGLSAAAARALDGARHEADRLGAPLCLPEHLLPAKVTRVFRGCRYEITITKNQKLLLPHVDGRKQLTVTV